MSQDALRDIDLACRSTTARRADPDVAEASKKQCRLSVVVPVFNEAENVGPLISEILCVFAGEQAFEMIFVDDASRDRTWEMLQESANQHGFIRSLRHRVNLGQSAAIATGFRAAQGEWIATLDGDGQNDPADILRMLQQAQRSGVDCVTGVRLRRQDSWARKISSRIANGFRDWITGDRWRDSACGIRVVHSRCAANLPVFNGMHRFLPTLLRAHGYSVSEMPVNHRPRLHGVSNYGVHNRLWRGIRDCFGVRWYRDRALPHNCLADPKDQSNRR